MFIQQVSTFSLIKGAKGEALGIEGASYSFQSFEEDLRISRRGRREDRVCSPGEANVHAISVSDEELAEEYRNRLPEEHVFGMREAQRILEGK